MGVSKQAAQKRFVPRGSADVPEPGNWSRFTDRARSVVVGAQHEARATGYPEAGPEHVLLGLLADKDSVAGKVIAAQGAALDTVSEAVLAAVSAGPGTVEGHVPFSAGARKLLALTLREALRPLVADAARRRELGAASRTYVEQVHDIEAVTDRLLALYARL